ncbi:ATP synthase subunit s, mitochondrial isoform X1 [Trematomus bernacchii]|uniref:ATP synthase subunit s, mitochondrial isoform X1 n=1 Tax=Trematomus bernacchii TaxID=40690 RepID=UPI00146B48F4|nr:ATP synthase subunit s, mitochondrial isoform X1 [Trematomus bernacchii]
MRLLTRAVQCAVSQRESSRRHFWGWLNAVFNKVDYERIQAVGPDRAAAEWLLRCGAKVRFQGLDRWQHDYNALPTGPLGRFKIQGIDATESCIMYRGFDHLALGGDQAEPVYLHRGHVSGEAEHHREPAAESAPHGGGVVWKRDRQGPHRPAQTQEPGAPVPERPAGDQRQKDDGEPAADGTPKARHLSGPERLDGLS